MKKYIVCALSVVFAALSCNKENTPVEEPAPAPKMLLASCRMASDNTDGLDSKVTLDVTNGHTEWVVGDKIFIHGNKVGTSNTEGYFSYVATVSSLSDDKKTAYFEIPEIARLYNQSSYNSSLFAAYPASAVVEFEGTPSWYYYSSFKNTNNLLLGGANDKTVDDGLSFEFQPLTGAISFTIDGSFYGGFDAYVFCGNNSETVGYTNYAFKIAKNKYGEWYNKFDTSSDSQLGPAPMSGGQTEISVESWTGADGTTVNTVYFPNADNFTFTNGFTLKFLKDGDVVKIARMKSSKQIMRGQLLNLGDITSRLIDPPTDHPLPAGWDDIADITDISADGKANCYIVPAAGQYKLPLVKGNSNEDVGNIGGVSILWETYNNNETVAPNSVIADADYYKVGDTKYLVFKTPATLKPGNALIAATNSAGIILWSWHIWIPETAIGEPIDDGDFFDKPVMDRNLGAINPATTSSVGIDTYGMYYQWGRKDPFPGPAKISVSLSRVVASSSTSVQYSILHPTEFIYDKEESGRGNWCNESIETLWNTSEGGKTVYDPCPAGYRVPKYDSSKAMWKSSDEAWTTDSATYSVYTTANNTFVYPICGYIESSLSGDNIGKRSIAWSAKRNNDFRGYGAYYRPEKKTAGFYAESYFKYIGASVRCVRE
ncbi:MAG: hypothetical protein IJ151_09175 [Bacteroidales bacterium]|nr:hypothetical protein [Bacteroidales bacterium]